jgi:IS5 family transposase
LHRHEEDGFIDAGYLGVDERDVMKGMAVKWQVVAKR